MPQLSEDNVLRLLRTSALMRESVERNRGPGAGRFVVPFLLTLGLICAIAAVAR